MIGGASALFEQTWHWLLAYGVALARPLAMLSLNPVFTRMQVTGLLRGAVASALAVPLVPRLALTLAPETRGAIGLLLLTGKEAVIGAALGLLLGAPFWALDVAGDVLDAQRGATQGRLNDPAGFEDVSITGTMLMVTGVVLFVLTGGLETLADLLYGSWRIWHPLSAWPSADQRTPLLLLGLLDRVTRQGLLLALPVVIAMLLADVSMLVVARLAPQLRVDDLALSARNVVFVIVMPLYAVFLLAYMREDQAALPGVLDLLRTSLRPALGTSTP